MPKEIHFGMAEFTVKAELAGRVIAIYGDIGASVTPADEIALIESMKMEIPVVASVSGKIVAFLVHVDDMIEEGQSILVVEMQ